MLESETGNFLTLEDFELKGKRVLVRVDLNSPLSGGKVQMNERIKQHALTLKKISEKGAKVVAVAHQGRPGSDFLESMEQHAKLLSKIVKTGYVDDLTGDRALQEIGNMKPGQVILLKNVRSMEEELESSPSNLIVRTLSPLFDLFVNDAFSVAHRDHASVTGFPLVLPSCLGRLMEREISALENLRSRKMVYILGGAKPEDNLLLLESGRAEKVLSTGIFSLLCLKARGYILGLEDKLLKDKESLVDEIAKRAERIETPVDLAIDDKGRKEIGIEELPVEKEILDIGKKTVKKYTGFIKKTEAVFFKGPAGKFEEKNFSKGTLGLLRAIEESGCFSLIGGGHSSHVIESFSLKKDKFSHISLAGGALIAYLAGEKLPGLEVLKV